MDCGAPLSTLHHNRKIPSPLLGCGPVCVERTIPASRVIHLYEKRCGIDVSEYFSRCDEVLVCRDRQTGYRFYWPFYLAGDGAFYGQLQARDWYYMEDKWEYDQALQFVDKEQALLELGCGVGFFLRRVSSMGVVCVGLERNPRAVADGRKRGVNISPEDVVSYAQHSGEAFGTVCAFQVLEHLADPLRVLRTVSGMLRSGGRLIVSVPNNDAFLKHDRLGVLNMPPHHMGLWTRKALNALAPLLRMHVERTLQESLQPHHVSWYAGVLRQRRMRILGERVGRRLNRAMKSLDRLWIQAARSCIRGHTLMVVYRKP